MYCYSGKEPIMEPIMKYYFGISETYIANIAMIEGYAFILGSIFINFIPLKYKNFNKMCLFGAILYFIGMLISGPAVFI